MKIFERVGMFKPKKSGFDKSHERKMSFNMGELIPCYMDEVVPGDQFKVNTELMIRMAPMIAPIMHRVNAYVHYFFVPNRIVWSEWEDFITGGREGTSNPTIPLRKVGDSATLWQEGTLADYMGLPVGFGVETAQVDVSMLPFRAYQQIYNDYYRDPNLTDAVDYTVTTNAMTLRKRAWEKDYFTSALPWTQRGTEPGIPVDGDGSVTYKSISELYTSAGSAVGTDKNLFSDSVTGDRLETGTTNPSGTASRVENIDTVDMASVSVSVNELRKTSAIQRWLEKQARGGGRYIETILSHFGVYSSDKRMQRAEYLGGGRQPIVISEVLNTSSTATEPQGNMAGHGISVGDNSFSARFEEHGYVFGILSVLPKTTYQQGINKLWLRDDKQDFYWPEYAHLGEQAVLNAELYYDKDDQAYCDGTFGYQQRYAEMKYACNSVHGEFRSSYDHWHMGRIFSSQPNLNESFVESDPTDRVFAVTAGSPDQILCQVYNNVKALRPMPYFANPRLS